jgi:hypothetical protein
MEPCFTLDGELLVPSMSAVSVWTDDMINGHHIGGLVAWGVERDHAADDMQVTRLTVDMFRPVPMKPLRVVTKPVRMGRRLRMVEVGILDGEVEVARGSALLLLRSDHPQGEPWTPEPWDVPAPEEVDPPTGESKLSWEVRRVTGWGEGGQGRVWMRELVPFVAGQEISPLLRAALSADFANPLVNSGPAGLAFINADLTMYITRDPVGDWIGMEASGHLGSGGVAVGTGWLHDRLGRFGQSSAAAMPDGRLAQRLPGT